MYVSDGYDWENFERASDVSNFLPVPWNTFDHFWDPSMLGLARALATHDPPSP